MADILRDQADKLREATAALKRAADKFVLANHSLKFAEKWALRKTSARAKPGTLLQFTRTAKRQPADDK